MPFVQGHYTHAPVNVSIRSECAHCGEPIAFELNETLDYRPDTGGELLIFIPLVDFAKLEDSSIIDAF